MKSMSYQTFSESDIEQIVIAAIESSGASSMKDMGSVMAIVKPQIQGRGDMGSVSGIVKAKLG